MIEIKKLGYSASPWRVVIDGEELYAPEIVSHPTMGKVSTDMPVCGETKQAVIDKMLNMLVLQSARINELKRAVNRIFDSECDDYPDRNVDTIARLWVIEQALAGRRLALFDMNSEMRDGYKNI